MLVYKFMPNKRLIQGSKSIIVISKDLNPNKLRKLFEDKCNLFSLNWLKLFFEILLDTDVPNFI